MSGMKIAPFRPSTSAAGQNLTLGAASVASAAVGTQTYSVQLSATGNCHVAIGRAAVTTDMLLKATDPPLQIAIGPGSTVNVIRDASATGTLNIVELTH